MAKSGDDENFEVKQTSCLTINIERYLKSQGVEKQKMEFKKSWNKGPTQFQVVRTISAFANDFYNDNGGYIVIGVEEDESEEATTQVKLPPVGIQPSDLDKIQKQILGACAGHIDPPYTPILSPEIVQGKHVLVIHAPASETRPHTTRESEKGPFSYFIRKGSETKKATNPEKQDLLRSSVNIPFDDRMAKHKGEQIHCQQIDKSLVIKYLDNVQSQLNQKLKHAPMMKRLDLVFHNGDKTNASGKLSPIYVPKNVALLMFNPSPHVYFAGAKIEIAQFSRDKDLVDEKVITGPLDQQIRQCIDFILTTTNKEKSVGAMNYPERALRESIVNAVYHRGYEPEHNNPTKIYIRPHCLEICSYPGPHASLKKEHFTSGSDIPLSPARNRRISDFLKDLKLAEARCTGVNTIFKTMKRNSNPEPQFEFDSDRFQVKLPAHPKFKAAILLKEVEEYEITGDLTKASKVIVEAFDKDPSDITPLLKKKLISLLGYDLDHPIVVKYDPYITENEKQQSSLLIELKRWLHSTNVREEVPKGVYLIEELVKVKAEATDLEDVTEFAINLSQEKDPDSRKPILKSNQYAHMLLEAYGDDILSSNGTIAYHLGFIKYNIYTIDKRKREKRGSTGGKSTKLLEEAEKGLRHAIVVSEQDPVEPGRLAQQYVQLGYIMFELYREHKATPTACEEWYAKALELNPKIHINTFSRPQEYKIKRSAPHNDDTTKKRCSLLNDLEKWLHSANAREDITSGVDLIKELAKIDADANDLKEVTKFAFNMSKERDPKSNKFILKSNEDAHMLLEAYGEDILSSNGTIAYNFGVIKYNIYTKNKIMKERRGPIGGNLTRLLKEAEDWLRKAIVISENSDWTLTEELVQQYVQLGYVMFELYLEKKATQSECEEWYDKALTLDPQIYISLFSQPKGYKLKRSALRNDDSLKKRCPLLNDLKKWLHSANARNEIANGVHLIKELAKVDAEANHLEEVTEFAFNMSNERDPTSGKLNLKSNEDAHLLLEAYGEDILTSSGTIAYRLAVIKYNIYVLNKTNKKQKGSRGRNPFSLLKEAENRLRHAIVISERDKIPAQQLHALQCRQLGYILFELYLARKEQSSACRVWYAKAKALDPKIDIPQRFIPRDFKFSKSKSSKPNADHAQVNASYVDSGVRRYPPSICETTKNRPSLLTKLEKWLQSADVHSDISSGVEIIEELVKLKSDFRDLEGVIKLALKMADEPNPGTRLKSNQDAHALLEACGEQIVSRNGNISYYFGIIKYKIYVLNEAENGRKGSTDGIQFKLLDEAKRWLLHAFDISNTTDESDLTCRTLEGQCMYLGHISFELFLAKKATGSEYKKWYERAREFHQFRQNITTSKTKGTKTKAV